MNNTPLTIRDHGNAIMLSESIELMARGLRETYLDHGLKSGDETAEQSLLAGLNLMAHAAHTLGNYVEQCQNELERAVAVQRPGRGGAMNKVEIKGVVEAIQWQTQGMMNVLEEMVFNVDGERWFTLSAGLS